MKCTDCDAETTPGQLWVTDEYRGLKFTRQVATVFCMGCGGEFITLETAKGDDNKLAEFRANVDKTLGCG